MNKRLFLDTATTSRPRFDMPTNHPSQPHIVRLALMLVDEDNEELLTWCSLVKLAPEWIMDPRAEEQHRISRAMTLAKGLSVQDALAVAQGLMDRTDELVAFNADFHVRMLERAALDAQMELRLPKPENTICAMREATPIVKKVPSRASSEYAWPKQTEAFRFFSGQELAPPDMEPVERGKALVRAVRIIHDGILSAQMEGARYE